MCTAVVLTLTTGLSPAIAMPAGSRSVSVTSTSGAEAVVAWNEIAMTTLLTAAIPTAEQPLYLAYTHRAVFLAAREAARRHASLDAAVIAAAHTVLVDHFASQQAVLDADYDAAIAGVPADLSRHIGVTIGRRYGTAVVRERADDGRNGPPLPNPAPGPGVWIPTPPNTAGASSWLGSVRPFVLSSAAQFRPAGPPSLTSAQWAKAYNETRLYGSATSSVRTPEQTEAARFWSDPPYAQNQRALRALIAGRGVGTLQAARIFAFVDTAAADALIACWDTKYHYWFWRPFSAIPAGDTDGNPATPADSSWQPLLGTPNHPEYASAHGCATAAMFIVLAKLLSTGPALDIDLDSVTTGTTHHFATVADLLDEVGNARVWGGIHWRFSVVAGVRIGRSVAGEVLRHGANLG